MESGSSDSVFSFSGGNGDSITIGFVTANNSFSFTSVYLYFLFEEFFFYFGLLLDSFLFWLEEELLWLLEVCYLFLVVLARLLVILDEELGFVVAVILESFRSSFNWYLEILKFEEQASSVGVAYFELCFELIVSWFTFTPLSSA